jgi:hypothetical protein
LLTLENVDVEFCNSKIELLVAKFETVLEVNDKARVDPKSVGVADRLDGVVDTGAWKLIAGVLDTLDVVVD